MRISNQGLHKDSDRERTKNFRNHGYYKKRTNAKPQPNSDWAKNLYKNNFFHRKRANAVEPAAIPKARKARTAKTTGKKRKKR